IPMTTRSSTRVNPLVLTTGEPVPTKGEPFVLHISFIRSSFRNASHPKAHRERSYGRIDMIAVSYSKRRRPHRSRMHLSNVTWEKVRQRPPPDAYIILVEIPQNSAVTQKTQKHQFATSELYN